LLGGTDSGLCMLNGGRGHLCYMGGYSFTGRACHLGARSSFMVRILVYIGGACSWWLW
jgi:hypothetical protein